MEDGATLYHNFLRDFAHCAHERLPAGKRDFDHGIRQDRIDALRHGIAESPGPGNILGLAIGIFNELNILIQNAFGNAQSIFQQPGLSGVELQVFLHNFLRHQHQNIPGGFALSRSQGQSGGLKRGIHRRHLFQIHKIKPGRGFGMVKRRQPEINLRLQGIHGQPQFIFNLRYLHHGRRQHRVIEFFRGSHRVHIILTEYPVAIDIDQVFYHRLKQAGVNGVKSAIMVHIRADKILGFDSMPRDLMFRGLIHDLDIFVIHHAVHIDIRQHVVGHGFLERQPILIVDIGRERMAGGLNRAEPAQEGGPLSRHKGHVFADSLGRRNNGHLKIQLAPIVDFCVHLGFLAVIENVIIDLDLAEDHGIFDE